MNNVAIQAHRVAFRSFGIPLAHVRATAAAVRELDGLRWRLRGRCSNDESGAWFMDPRTPAARSARSVCASCPVRARCLSAALLYGEEYGIWGGLDTEQRAALDGRLQRGETLRAVVTSAFAQRVDGDLDEAV
ncbi:WhiB family transcriptional regulator [Phycicoccus duodecadis]|uniref:WhiB family transcriptional regulator n=1 Tax=Phycicoccus duodecadis TaxID=173053 RepID=UPI000C712BE3|nr:WhiB family transcriptional regulator [Phycicoccus duodecadis]